MKPYLSKWFRLAASVCLLASVSTAVVASGAVAQLQAFSKVRTLEADFVQQQTRADGRIEQASGRLSIAHPGKFYWRYLTPYQQTIVSDGKTVWFYDADLEQVIIRAQEAAIGDKPAMLLSDPQSAARFFRIRNLAARGDGLAWLEAVPNDKDGASFSSIEVGFKDNKPVKLLLADLFGGRTTIELKRLRTGMNLDMTRFQFTPPPGVDVLSD